MFSRSVDVMTVDLTTIEVDEDLLSVAELGRALGIASPAALRQYLAAHTWLRLRLADYLDYPAADIRFRQGIHGKPEIVTPETDLAFNLSYSGGRAVLASGFRMAVGVDIEKTEGAKVNPDMLHRVLTPPEAYSVQEAPDMVREFLRLWVRKEALAKATGWGVDQDPSSTSVLGVSPVSRDGFDLTDINLGEGYVAAAAVPVGCSIDLMTLVEVAA
ncbi:MAG: 4'-phosphopantetheinyl transferase superfamily protein [Acidimicrobiia bacterium]|nr:4'-phosphopantetheinyl transferase superfamily protein [Acidimicrobiia bacterium]